MKKRLVLIAVIVVLLAGGKWFLWKHAELAGDRVIESYKQTLVADSEAKIKALLDQRILSEQNTEARTQAFARFWSDFQEQSPDAFRIKIWNENAVIVWSNMGKIIGESYPDNEDLIKSLKEGKVVFEYEVEVEKAEQASERRLGSFTETYLPIFGAEGKIVGVLEVYQAAGALTQELNAARQPFIFSMIAAAFTALVALGFVIKRTSA